MKSTYVNYGGEKIVQDYVEAIAYLKGDARLIVHGISTKDAQDTLQERFREFRKVNRGDIIIHSPKLLEQRLEE